MGAQASDGLVWKLVFLWCGASAVGMGPGNESTFQGLKAADTAMPTSGLFCLFQQISHVKSVCFRGRGWGVWGPQETMGVRGWGLLTVLFWAPQKLLVLSGTWLPVLGGLWLL